MFPPIAADTWSIRSQSLSWRTVYVLAWTEIFVSKSFRLVDVASILNAKHELRRYILFTRGKKKKKKQIILEDIYESFNEIVYKAHARASK